MTSASAIHTQEQCESDFIAIDDIPDHFCAQESIVEAKRSFDDIEMDIASAKARQSELKTRYDQACARLLAIESDLKQRLTTEFNQQNNELKTKISDLETEKENLRIVHSKALLDSKYKRIDMSFLTRRKWSKQYNCALPLFSPYRLNDSLFVVSATAASQRRNQRGQLVGSGVEPICTFQSSLPVLMSHFADILQHLHQGAIGSLPITFPSQNDTRAPILPELEFGRECKVTLQSRFTGAIPNDVREIISASAKEFEEVYLVAEAPEWELNTVTVIIPQPEVKRDPLVIGQKHDTFWLITKFDTTPAEEYTAREFTFEGPKQD